MSRVVFEDVQKVYPDGTQAIFDLDLEIADEEFVVFVGPSGCGKSTALRMIAGLEEITGGTLRIGDRVVNDLTPKERDIAMVFQSYALYPHMSVAENMGFALRLSKVPASEIDRRTREAAEILGLTEYLHRRPKALSGGQRQRVAMGRAIVREPKAFLMDEPLSNLDAKLRVQMRAEISSLQRRLRTTMVYVTHDQIEAMTMGDRVAVLKRGRLQQVDSPQDLYDAPKNLFVAGFIGSPSMNLMGGRLRRDDGRTVIELDDGASALLVPDETLERHPGAVDRIGDLVAVGIRPEHLTTPDQVAPDQVWRSRRVVLVEKLGAEVLVHLETKASPIAHQEAHDRGDDEVLEDLEARVPGGGQRMIARFEPGRAPEIDEIINIGVRTEHLYLFDPVTGTAL